MKYLEKIPAVEREKVTVTITPDRPKMSLMKSIFYCDSSLF